jgi:transcription elongation factor GreA
MNKMQTAEQNVYLTPEGLQKLKEELADLKERGRRQVAERIKTAKEFGDLSENAEYHAAKEEQSFIEGRISELEELIRRASVIKKSTAKDEVAIGSTVEVKINGGHGVFTIVGSAEADPTSGKISNESPLGRALLGKAEGEQIQVEAPGGTVSYTIHKIR